MSYAQRFTRMYACDVCKSALMRWDVWAARRLGAQWGMKRSLGYAYLHTTGIAWSWWHWLRHRQRDLLKALAT